MLGVRNLTSSLPRSATRTSRHRASRATRANAASKICSVPTVLSYEKSAISTTNSVVVSSWNSSRSYASKSSSSTKSTSSLDARSVAAVRLVQAYRQDGHNFAQTNPLKVTGQTHVVPEFAAKLIGSHANESVALDDLSVRCGPTGPVASMTLEQLNQHLASSYCGPLSAQFVHLPAEEAEFFADKMESMNKFMSGIPKEDKLHYHSLVQKAEVFDHYLQKKFRTTKRYGLEGNEAMLVALDYLFDKSAVSGTSDVVLTMLHRGRLNTLVDLLNYPMDLLVHKLKGNSIIPDDLRGNGDVLSHIDQHTDFASRFDPSKKTHISFIPNPSHLESSAPVAMGKAYARSKLLANNDPAKVDSYDGVLPPTAKDKVLCVMVHGDASVAGQGVIAETALLANLNHFSIGGSVHIVANNQLGFTAMSHEGRSWQYCTDVAKMLNVPVLHVSGEHPEHVAYATAIALEYKNKFKKDVWIDIIGWRKHGHNELDEPAFTQPGMYQNIRSRESIPSLYAKSLMKQGIIKSEDEVNALRAKYDAELDVGFQKHAQAEANGGYVPHFDHLQGPKWSKHVHPSPKNLSKLNINPDTSFDAQKLVDIGLASTKLPSDFTPHERLARTFVEARQQKLQDGVNSKELDWATAEAMAYGSLLLEGHSVRVCGQDACRGTFSQRHAKLTDQKVQSRTYMPLNNIPHPIKPKTARYEVVNSPLSEFAVMGFEYGHSIEDPNTLSIWEAQYGDFVNGAQIMLDNYISSGDDKWLRQSGLVLLLPHGYDGAGPEHSSCHLERFLQSADTDMINKDNFANLIPNWTIMVPTTPANYFHALRRQLKRNYLRPLVVAAPKQLLRDPTAISSVSELSKPGSKFQPVLGDPDHSPTGAEHVRTVALMSGKVFYELRAQRKERKRADTALIRVEELAPFPAERIMEEIAKYPRATRVAWIQDEPQNMGSWSYVEPRLRNFCGVNPVLISPPPLASAAVGASVLHKKVTAELYDAVFPQKRSL